MNWQNGKWNDERCTDIRPGFVCKTPKSAVSATQAPYHDGCNWVSYKISFVYILTEWRTSSLFDKFAEPLWSSVNFEPKRCSEPLYVKILLHNLRSTTFYLKESLHCYIINYWCSGVCCCFFFLIMFFSIS
jgi:hypothetical protein